MMFMTRVSESESLPPTTVAHLLHIEKTNHLSLILNNDIVANVTLPSQTENGWNADRNDNIATSTYCGN